MLFLFSLSTLAALAQTRLQVADDSVRIMNGELIIRNNTKGINGYLYNKGNGLTEFRPVDNISGSEYEIAITKNELDSAIAGSTLQAGMQYRISGVCPALYGGTDIIVSAVTNNRISIYGSGLFYNPRYASYEFYSKDSSYAIGDTATWGGYVWVNKSGHPGTGINAFALSSSDWNKLPYDTIRYVQSWDDIRYNYGKDHIFFRRDDLNNEVLCDSNAHTIFPDFPIRAFKWGSPKIYNNTVRESYAEFINIDTSSRVNGNTISGYSYIGNNTFTNCFFTGNTLERTAKMEYNDFKNAAISFNSLAGGSLAYNTVTGRPVYDLSQGAGIMYNDMRQGRIDSNVVAIGEDSIAWISNNAGMGDITNCFITNGEISDNTLSNSTISSDTLFSGGSIVGNFVSGIIADCRLSTGITISGNRVINSKISKSVYTVSGCSMQSYLLEPAAEMNEKMLIGNDFTLVLSGFGVNKRLTSDASGNAAWSYPSLILGGTSPTSSIVYQSTTGTGDAGADHIFKTGNNGATEAMRILNNGNVGIGTSSPLARLHLLRNAEQLRIGYDASNYSNIIVGSTGSTTIGATGNASALNFNGSTVVIQQGGADRVLFNSSSATAGIVRIAGGSAATVGGIGLNAGSGSYTSASDMQYATALLPTISQEGSGGYSGLLISPAEASTGSGLKSLVDIGKNTGGTPATHTSLLRVDNTGKITITATNTATGSTGAKTINKPAGSVNFAASSQTLVVTNSTVTAASVILLTIEANDSSAKSVYVAAKAAGTFTIKLNAAAAAETKVNFLVLN